MIQKILAKDRHFSDIGWLQTHWLFSFSDYYDPANVNHGALRVFNDDIVQSRMGFGTHPHEEMEIVSIVLEGEMTHKDSMGNEMVIRKNDVQRMTAGTGLQHSEVNDGEHPVTFFQIWLLPELKGLVPSYDQKSFHPDFWQNKLALLATDEKSEEQVTLNTSASIFRAKLSAGFEITHAVQSDQYQFIYVIDGKLTVNGRSIESRDQLRIKGEELLVIKAEVLSGFILIECPGHVD